MGKIKSAEIPNSEGLAAFILLLLLLRPLEQVVEERGVCCQEDGGSLLLLLLLLGGSVKLEPEVGRGGAVDVGAAVGEAAEPEGALGEVGPQAAEDGVGQVVRDDVGLRAAGAGRRRCAAPGAESTNSCEL